MERFVLISAYIWLVTSICASDVTPKEAHWHWGDETYDLSTQTRTQTRTSESVHFDEIQQLDVISSHVRATEGYDLGHKYDEKHYDPLEKYAKYDKYDKPDKKQRNTTKKKKTDTSCKVPKVDQCVALFATVLSGISPDVVVLKTVRGSPLELGSTFIKPSQRSVIMFSNKARGSYSKDYDVGLTYSDANGDQILVRMRYDGDQANLVYESNFVSRATSHPSFSPFVTDMSKFKKTMIIDAYNFFSPADPSQAEYKQINLNSKTGELVQDAGFRGPCFDIAFFDKEEDCSRWICVGRNPEPTLYLRDATTGTNYIPPPEYNPLNLIEVGGWVTAGRFCHKHYVGIVGVNLPNVLQVIRAKSSNKYPYFKKPQVIYSIEIAGITPYLQIYSPPDTDTIFVCAFDRFWRFDNAYTGVVPIKPAVDIHIHVDACTRILSFRECPNEVYVAAMYQLMYSNNGGQSFQPVSPGPFSFTPSNSLTGFKDTKLQTNLND